MIRVAHVITRLCRGGAQENTFHTVRLANRARYDVDLISGVITGSEDSMEDQVRAAGIGIIRVPHLSRNPHPVHDYRAYRFLKSLFQEKQYDIVHTHTSKAGFLGRLAAHHAGVPIIVHTPHGHIFHGYFSSPMTRFYTLLERHAARKSDALIALTERGIEEHLAHGVGRRDQWSAIFSGIDLGPFENAIRMRRETREGLGIKPDTLLVGAAGRLEPVKGFAYFVEAAHLLVEECPEVRFVLAGDGSQRSFLEGQAADLSLQFEFLGMRDDIPALMAAMDLFVLPSLNEGMGRVLLEAAAAGVPVVATAVGGVPEIVKDGVTGLLVPPEDATALAGAMQRLLADCATRRRMGETARAEVAPRHGLGSMVQRIEALYETLLREKGLEG